MGKIWNGWELIWQNLKDIKAIYAMHPCGKVGASAACFYFFKQ